MITMSLSALSRVRTLLSLLTVQQVQDAGPEAIQAAGIQSPQAERINIDWFDSIFEPDDTNYAAAEETLDQRDSLAARELAAAMGMSYGHMCADKQHKWRMLAQHVRRRYVRRSVVSETLHDIMRDR